jgi:hypothetical protein
MGIQNSYLSKSGYGYDTVLAVNPTALNGIMKQYYANAASKFAETTMYFIKDGSGNAKVIDQASLLTLTGNIDPLNVASTDKTAIAAVVNANFYFAFKFTPGDPTKVAGWSYNYLTFVPGTQKVVYTLCCKDIQLAFYDSSTSTFTNESQATSLYNINSTITLQNIENNDNLPTAVQQEVKDLGNQAVSVYQLLFDLDSAVTDPSTSIPVLTKDSALYTPLLAQFVPAYLDAFNSVVGPAVLNYSVTAPNDATLVPTAMDFCYEQAVDSNGNPITTAPTQNTLNYLFATNGHTLPAPAQFDWNWLDAADISNGAQGAMAINRNSFATFFHNQLKDYVGSNCFTPDLQVNPFPYSPEYEIDINGANYAAGGGVQPINLSSLGFDTDTLLQYTCSGNSTATGWGPADTMHVNTFYMLQLCVDMPDQNQPLIQNLILTQMAWLFINATGNPNVGSQKGGNPPYQGYALSRSYTDTFSVIVDPQGYVNLTNTNSKVQDNSDTNLPVYIQETMTAFKNWNTAYSFKEIPVTMPKQFVFPGGNTFTFSNAGFSQYSDLVCNLRFNNIS